MRAVARSVCLMVGWKATQVEPSEACKTVGQMDVILPAVWKAPQKVQILESTREMNAEYR